MRIKNIVKVMNFHALLHIDEARRMTEKYIRMESEISKIIDIIINNRNFVLDKITLTPNETLPPLNIFIGSDLSFSGSLNSQVNSVMLGDDESEKIVVGRKLRQGSASNVRLAMSKDEFDEEFFRVEEVIEDSIFHLRHSSINVVYNHYYYAGRIALREKRIFPIAVASDPESYTEDFVIEGNPDRLLRSLTSTFSSYEVRLAAISSYASENVIRQNTTTESLKKIEEIEEEEWRVQRKVQKAKAFEKVLDSYVKKIAHREARQ
ncbi:MAG: F0F1 ATP synthase subunit gamma [Coriobacteriales bacterium]|jgi:F0F1-type ATP synthase gamma subunit|nr:F0F1 ATP synthase subunit gamma [Coriobacteriales bacterium]